MRKLLVPVDGSDNAKRALEYAIKIAREKGANELHIVYAHEPPIIYGEIAIHMTEERAKELQRQHGEALLAPNDRNDKSGRHPVHNQNPDW